jgi:hypothetical protein
MACLIFGTVVSNVRAATITAKSCSLTDVRAAVEAASRGDTVTVPAGDCTWNGTVSFNKAITIQGAGKASTFIRSGIIVPEGTMSRNASTYSMLYYSPTSIASDTNVTLRITGFTFDMNYRSSGLAIYNKNNTPLNKLIIDNNDFLDGWDGRYPTSSNDWTAVYALSVYGTIYGVIHNNRFYGYPKVETMGRDAYAYNETSLNYSHGTANSLYWEDNEFYGTGNTGHTDSSWWIDNGAGAWMVMRYNTFTSTQPFTNAGAPWSPHHPVNAGGYASKGGEFYGNYMTYSSTGSSLRMFTTRGGKSLIFYNKQYANGANGTQFMLYDPSVGSKYRPPATTTVCGSDTMFSGLNMCDKSGQPQHTWRSYSWNNRVGKTGSGSIIIASANSSSLVENRDYANHNTACTASSCTSGVGCGSATPTGMCTTGTGYWKTSQSCSDLTDYVGASPTTPIAGILYRCASTNNWQAYYTPYTYPHPLRSGDPDNRENISSPKGFKLVQ